MSFTMTCTNDWEQTIFYGFFKAALYVSNICSPMLRRWPGQWSYQRFSTNVPQKPSSLALRTNALETTEELCMTFVIIWGQETISESPIPMVTLSILQEHIKLILGGPYRVPVTAYEPRKSWSNLWNSLIMAIEMLPSGLLCHCECSRRCCCCLLDIIAILEIRNCSTNTAPHFLYKASSCFSEFNSSRTSFPNWESLVPKNLCDHSFNCIY